MKKYPEKLKPLDIKNSIHIAEAHIVLGREAIANEKLLSILENKPFSRGAIFNQAISLERLGELKYAILKLERLAKLDPLNAGVHFALGLYNGKMRNWDVAYERLKEALRLDPEDEVKKDFYAMILCRRGKYFGCITSKSLMKKDMERMFIKSQI